MTFSVIAKSPDGQYLGVAVATKLTNVGQWIPFGSGLGGVFTLQALLTPEYRAKSREIIKRLENGEDPESILIWILENDHLANRRQIQIMDLAGNQASFTGVKTLSKDYHRLPFTTYAEHLYGQDVSVAGNILSNPDVVSAMLGWYESNVQSGEYSFPRLLIGTLMAAEEAGGDARKVPSFLPEVESGILEDGYSAAFRLFKIGRKEAILSLDINNSPTPIQDLLDELENMC